MIFKDWSKTATVQTSIDLFTVVILKLVFDLIPNSAEQQLAVANILSNRTLNVCEYFTVMYQVTKTLKVSVVRVQENAPPLQLL